MKMLKLLVPTLLLLCTAGCRSDDDAAVRALARRIIPEQEARFRFEHLADTGDSTDRFELDRAADGSSSAATTPTRLPWG